MKTILFIILFALGVIWFANRDIDTKVSKNIRYDEITSEIAKCYNKECPELDKCLEAPEEEKANCFLSLKS